MTKFIQTYEGLIINLDHIIWIDIKEAGVGGIRFFIQTTDTELGIIETIKIMSPITLNWMHVDEYGPDDLFDLLNGVTTEMMEASIDRRS